MGLLILEQMVERPTPRSGSGTASCGAGELVMCESLRPSRIRSGSGPERLVLPYREHPRPCLPARAHTDQPERRQAPAADLLGRKLILRVLD